MSAHRITPARLGSARAVRELVHALAGADADDETLVRVRGLVEEATLLLADAPRRTRAVPDFATIESLREAGEEPGLHAMGDRAVAGPANPASVELEPRFEDGEVVAEVRFGPAFEGAPGRVHGGVVAAVFDDLLGTAMARQRSPGFTGRLTVHYRAPVPIERALEFRARISKVDGRKLTVHAWARLDDRVVAEADALFVLVDQQHFATPAHDLLALERDDT